MRVSEAEINSCTRQFLMKNNFNFLSTLNNGEKFYYRINKSFPPLLKQPDNLVYKDNIVIIWEEKVKYNDLFKSSGDKVSDIEKLGLILDNEELQLDFLGNVSEIIGYSTDDIILCGGVNSLKPTGAYKKRVPEELIHLVTSINVETSIELVGLPKHLEKHFQFKSCKHEL